MTFEREAPYVEPEVLATIQILHEHFNPQDTLESTFETVSSLINDHNAVSPTPLEYGRGGHHIWVSDMSRRSGHERILIIRE